MMGKFIIGVFNTSAVVGLSIVAASILLKVSSKSYSARCRKRIWIFMAFSLLIPFHLFSFPGAVTAEIPNVVLREFDSRKANGAGGQEITNDSQQSVQNQDVQASQNPSMQAAQSQALQNSAQGSGQGTSKAELTVADLLFAVWACVGVLLTVWFAAGYWRMKGRIRRWSSECEDGYVQEITREIAAKCNLKKIPEVRIMKDSTEGPFTTGVLKNIIILPDDVLHEKDLRFILKHEIIHCRNNDISWNLLFLVVNIIHWFNPLVWYLRRAAEQDMEIACDEEVVALASREDRKEYGDVIMSWVERGRYRGSAVSTGYVKGVGFLKRRFDSIFNGGKKKNGILLAGGVCVFALLIGCAVQLQSGGKVYAKKEIAIDYGYEVKTDVNGDGEVDRVYVFDNEWAGIDLDGSDLAETRLHVRLSNGEETCIRYEDHNKSYLVTGDLSGNGAADIVLIKIGALNVYDVGDIIVLHVQTDETGKPELVEYPGNFIHNPDLEPKWVGWEEYTDSIEHILDDEYGVDFTAQPDEYDSFLGSWCRGATIIEKNGKTMLRMILFVDKWTDSVKCIDCTYTPEGWYIEDMQIVYGYGYGSKWEDELLGTWR